MAVITVIAALFTVFSGVTAMGLHRLADRPRLELVFWGLTLALFLFFEYLLHISRK